MTLQYSRHVVTFFHAKVCQYVKIIYNFKLL